MRKILVIAWREFIATVKTKAFLIGVIMMPIMMGGGAIASIINEKFEDNGVKTFVVVDRTPGAKVAPLLQKAIEKRNKSTIGKDGKRTSPEFKLEIEAPKPDIDEQRVEMSERIRKDKIAGFLEIGPEANSSKSTIAGIVEAFAKPKSKPAANNATTTSDEKKDDPTLSRFQSRPTTSGAMEFYRWSLMQITLITRFGMTNVDEKTQESIFNAPPPVVMLGLTTRDEKSGKAVDDTGNIKAFASLAVGFASMMMIFMMVMVGATPLLQSVLEEKMQKISEVLLGSVTPFQLMAGKLIGMVGVALLLASIYVGGALSAVHQFGFGQYVPMAMIAWFILYLVLAVIMYGSLFSAIGAACSDMKEPQTLMLPVMLPMILPMMLVGIVVKNPDGLIARVLSFFPPSTPMIMTLRQGMNSNIQWWEPALGAMLVMLFTLGCVWVAGRIFRIGILMQGKAPSFKQLIQWVITG